MSTTSKENGLRAWRKWCKRARLRMNKHHRALYRGAIMRKKQPERTPLPVKPFTTRSIVGMTMGARKRAAQAAGIARSTYRIGQKLRPCAGCIRCQCRSAFDAWPELGEALAKDLPTCDGSGVLPSRKEKT